MKDLEIRYTVVDSPLGEIFLARNDEGLTRMSFQEGTRALTPGAHWRKEEGAFNEERTQLAAYPSLRVTPFFRPSLLCERHRLSRW